ncbi:MAG TPA: di-trans,poly-cis-decaprenylcistransferase [Bryobacteraceae bacterium]|nr:di-trans,poly-cis-decaprenylcistransferase [Bryobacteraceae bacterium]
MKSTSHCRIHVAIIMDGNGRWANARGLPRLAGHHAGAEAVRRTVEAAADLGVPALTLYAFSSDNWKRPAAEVKGLMQLFREFLMAEMPRCVEAGIRVEVIGRRDRLDPMLAAAIAQVEYETGSSSKLHLRIAVDYSSRESILRTASRCQAAPSREEFSHLLDGVPDVDLLIRTGGERRLSDFLLWESAYAELVFTERMWPDFTREDLEQALNDFARRERRFGGLPGTKELVPAGSV